MSADMAVGIACFAGEDLSRMPGKSRKLATPNLWAAMQVPQKSSQRPIDMCWVELDSV